MAQVQINLLTKEFRKKGAVDANGVKWVIFLVLLAMVGLGGWQFVNLLRLSGEEANYQADLNSLQKQIVPVQNDLARLDAVNHLQTVIKNLRASGPEMNQILAAIQAKTPAGIELKSLTVQSGTIELQVQATSLNAIEAFSDSLAAVKGFSNVQLKSLTDDANNKAQASLSLQYNQGGWRN